MKNKIFKALKEKGIFYGKKYTIQAMYDWNYKKGAGLPEEFELREYTVCENKWIKDGGEKHLVPLPTEYYKIEELEKAVEEFIKKEYK